MARAAFFGRCRVGMSPRAVLPCRPLRSAEPHKPALTACMGCRAARHFRTSSLLSERARNDGQTLRTPTLAHPGRLDVNSAAARKALSEMGFAFELLRKDSIDGVLYQGQTPIPGAREMLRNLRSQGVRYLFLTNGGGHHEDTKVESLSKRLGMGLDEDVIRHRVVLSHTPKRGWSEEKKSGTVLITGSHPDVARRIAKDYGFKRVVIPADIIAADDKVFPFDNLRESLHSSWEKLPDGKDLRRTKDVYSKELPADLLKIDQILVWNDPRDWALDIQIITDLLTSYRGYVGTVSEKNGNRSLPNNGWQQDDQPELWISNLDLVWKTEYPVNRFGTGAFVEALKGVWAAVTGGAELKYNALGKPSSLTYNYAHDRLLHYQSDLAKMAATGATTAERVQEPLRRVYMIGDNPESDIRGANEFRAEDGTEWVSILVKTGVWQQTLAETEPRYRPAVIVDDVVDAIVWAMRNEGLDVDRKWVLGNKV
ncbi:hypothetical protein S40293_01788 [Stachybotrys chartarum IBT 40293]|nr:hypothetical protein S40293_01788 [Stachybotrys chartarum IBT 40293]